MRRAVAFAIRAALCLTAGSAGAAPLPAPPAIDGPDVPPVTAPAAVVTVFENERYFCDGSPHSRTIDVPAGSFNRVILSTTITPDGDVWDRLIGVAIGGVEVLRGTTPRTAMTLRKDITRYAALLPPGGTATVSLLNSTYVGKGMLGTVRIEFYANEPTAPPLPPATVAMGPFTWAGLNRGGERLSAAVEFPAVPPSMAVAELTLSGHGTEEFWFAGIAVPRRFTILVDGQEVAVAAAMPYVYAFLGFGNEYSYAVCSGQAANDPFGDTVHPVMWWTAQQALDAAGVHTGVGEIPPYRIAIDPAVLPLLAGTRTVEVRQEYGFGTWVTSLAFLLHA
ncbi:MAG: peptide-N4-asparagine amidase [Actinomycetota bacterium]